MNPIDKLKSLLPDAGDEIKAAIDSIEHEHKRSTHERRFLERAPMEGLLHPSDALKLEDVATELSEAEDPEQALQDVFASMRSSRPWLFRQASASPTTQKLSEPGNAPPALRHGSLTRQVQELRRRKRP